MIQASISGSHSNGSSSGGGSDRSVINNFLWLQFLAKSHMCTRPFNPHNHAVDSTVAPVSQMKRAPLTDSKLTHGGMKIWRKA